MLKYVYPSFMGEGSQNICSSIKTKFGKPRAPAEAPMMAWRKLGGVRVRVNRARRLPGPVASAPTGCEVTVLTPQGLLYGSTAHDASRGLLPLLRILTGCEVILIPGRYNMLPRSATAELERE